MINGQYSRESPVAEVRPARSPHARNSAPGMVSLLSIGLEIPAV